jgi:hypothetical protein
MLDDTFFQFVIGGETHSTGTRGGYGLRFVPPFARRKDPPTLLTDWAKIMRA